MRILFLHQNFPGQFLHLAPALKARGHEVLALVPDTNKRQSPIPVARFSQKDLNIKDPQAEASSFPGQVRLGTAVAQAAAHLDRQVNFKPDVIVGHPGWGETMFIKEVWPDARLAIYAEFFYGTRGRDTGFDPATFPTNLASSCRTIARRAGALLSMNAAEAAMSPTRWQASTFPDWFRDRITVVHDGVDTGAVTPAGPTPVELVIGSRTFRPGDEVLTFISRSLEPYRGFHIFARALPRILRTRPEAHVVIVGRDEPAYSGQAPGGRSWKDIFLDEVRDELDMSRVHFMGLVSYQTFLTVLRVSRVHAYLTYPFVLSWSMLEAMSAGALVVGSRTPPVEEVIEHGRNGLLVDFFDVDAWSSTLSEALARPERYESLRSAARRTIVDGFDLKTICLPRMVAFVEGLGVSAGDKIPH